MRVIGVEVLEEFGLLHSDARSQLDAWLSEAKDAKWLTYNQLKARYASASLLSGNRVVFNIKGRKYRLLVRVGFKQQLVLVEKVGTHAEYSKWAI